MTVQAFRTPDNELSFSGLIDKALIQTGRVAQFYQTTGYLNSVIRECQFKVKSGNDLVEDQITSTADPHTWEIPDTFREMSAVRYLTSNREPSMRRPMRGLMEEPYFYYQSNDVMVFKGVDYVHSESIAVAYYTWADRLSYYKQPTATLEVLSEFDKRPAYYDSSEFKWKYLDSSDQYVDTLNDTAAEALARRKSSNWIIRQWPDLLLDGLKAKIFNGVGDTRGPKHYGAFQEGLKLFQSSSGFESNGA